MNAIITRFAPSPTGNLHVGSVRTALINYIITKQAKIKYPESKFLLRIEDTDKKRSSNEYKKNILKNLNWLAIEYDDEPYIQSSKILQHQKIAFELIKNKKAFKCICSIEELNKRREKNRINKNNNKRLCKDCEKDLKIQSLKKDFVVRIKIPQDGEVNIEDLIQGHIKVNNKEIDDFILLRKDGTPTYMLSVVVDDFNMNVNFIIRGDDHLNNTFKQIHIYKNLNWLIPRYAHLPLIHGEDGKKLSKRHGAVDINEFRELGYLKESIINNLILLGWSPGKKNESIEINEIIDLYKLENLSKSSSIFSYQKLNFFNNFHIQNDEGNEKILKYCKSNLILNDIIKNESVNFFKIYSIYKKKILFFKELENIYNNYFDINFSTKKNILLTNEFKSLIKEFYKVLNGINEWTVEILEKTIKDFINIKEIKFISFGRPMRLLLINQENGPSLNEILFILGKKITIKRINNYISLN